MVEGEIYGVDNCDSSREEVIDPDPSDPDACLASNNNDGNVLDDPDVHVPSGQPKKNDDEEIVERDADDVLLRNSWGGWQE